MPILDSTFPNGNFSTLEKKHSYDLLALNNVLQESLKKAQGQVDKAQLIVRCENLPSIKADQTDMIKLFDHLLNMILNPSLKSSKQFLYVDCEEDASDAIDMTRLEGFKRYTVKFYTNVSTHNNWKLLNGQALINCRQILSKYNGNLVVNEISSSGCLFSVSLPGKFE